MSDIKLSREPLRGSMAVTPIKRGILLYRVTRRGSSVEHVELTPAECRALARELMSAADVWEMENE